MPEIRLLSPCPAEAHVLLYEDRAVLHPDHVPGWVRALAAELDEDTGFQQVDGRPLLAAAVAGDREAQVLIGGEVVWRCRCHQLAVVRYGRPFLAPGKKLQTLLPQRISGSAPSPQRRHRLLGLGLPGRLLS